LNEEGGETEMNIHDRLSDVLSDIQTEVAGLITNRYIYFKQKSEIYLTKIRSYLVLTMNFFGGYTGITFIAP
jgi:hypothetical protein